MARARLTVARFAPSLFVVLACMGGLAPARGERLGELYDAALQRNPIVQARAIEIERARAESDGALSRLRPQVTAQAAVSANTFDDPVTDRGYGGKRVALAARQSLFDLSSARRLDAARAMVGQRELELAQLRQLLFGELLDRYLQALQARDEQAAIAAESTAARQQAERLQTMYARQLAKINDLAEGRAYVQSLLTRAIDAENAEAVAMARLRELCGCSVASLPGLSRASFEPLPESRDESVGRALQGHPRLLALAQAVETAQRGVDAARAEHAPQVAATLSRVYADQGYDNRQQPPYHASSVGIELRVPLYEGGRVEASVREAAAREGIARKQLDAARAEVERETVTQWLSAVANHARIGSGEGEVAALEQTVQAQEKGLELGASRVTDLLDARRRLLKARADLAKARYDFIRDVVGLQLRSARFGPQDIAVWESWFAGDAR